MAGTIRNASEDDIARITEIYTDAVAHGTATYELEAPDATEMLARFRTLRASAYPYLVHEEDSFVTGYAYAGPFRARPAYRFIVEDSIYLAPEAKGRGIGRKLLNALIEICRADGYRQFVAVIGDGSPTSPSVRLHEAVGMRHCGQLVGSGYKHGRWLDTTFMQLDLNGGNATPPDPESVPEKIFQGR
jgi:L-amino acid N-acyltransferase YncA